MNKQKAISLIVAQFFFNAVVYAEGTASDVQRNIEQLNVEPIAPEKPIGQDSQRDMTNIAIDKLNRVEVEGGIEAKSIQDYFAKYIGHPISEAQLENFNGWVWSLLRRSGYLAYVSSSQQKEKDGSVLLVKIQQPVVRTLRVSAEKESTTRQYQALLISRFSDVVLPGKPLNLQYLENQIAAANFDLPVDIRASIQTPNSGKVDLVLHVKDVPAKLGHLSTALVQANNFGLKRYGRPQAVGAFSVGGFTPFSELQLTTLVSQGVRYARAEYEQPVVKLKGRLRFFGGYTASESIRKEETDTEGKSKEFGVGFSKVIKTTQSALFKAKLDVLTRTSVSSLKLGGFKLEDIRDNKVKLTFSADNEPLSLDQFRYELSFTQGHYSTKGRYSKQEIFALVKKTLSDNAQWESSFRFHGQLSNSNLDSYDKIALGGLNGVRAYSSDDGLGDQGFVASFDVLRRLKKNRYIGVFYDCGLVRPNRFAIPYANNNTYSLQGVGIQMGGELSKGLFYSMVLSKAIGSYENYVDGSIESSPKNWRFLASLSKQF